MADEKKESEKKEEESGGKKYTGGAIPKATKAAVEARKEAEAD